MASPSFEATLGYYLSKEGGFVDDSTDLGGTTNYGIAWNYQQETLKKYGVYSKQDLKNISYAQVSRFYKAEFWDRFNLGKISDRRVATKMFDAIAAAGPKVLKMVGGIDSLNRLSPEEAMKKIGTAQRDIYAATIRRKPEQVKFKEGWWSRTASVPTSAEYDPRSVFDRIARNQRTGVQYAKLDLKDSYDFSKELAQSRPSDVAKKSEDFKGNEAQRLFHEFGELKDNLSALASNQKAVDTAANWLTKTFAVA